MASQSDLAIYRRFMAAHHFDLMLQQAELTHLFHELAECKLENIYDGTTDASAYDTSFRKLIESSADPSTGTQWHKLMAIRQKLKEHGDHLLQVQSLINLHEHNKDDLDVLRRWLRRGEGGRGFLTEAEWEVWAHETAHDLTSLNGHGSDLDPFSRFLEDRVITWINDKGLYKLRKQYTTITDAYLSSAQYKRDHSMAQPSSSPPPQPPPGSPPAAPHLTTTATPSPLPPTTLPPHPLAQSATRLDIYSSKKIHTMTAIFSTTLSSLLPTMSIFALYFVRTQLLRLGMILIFTTVFSALFALISRPRRAEGFAAAAAFAAVLVVFVSGDDGPGCRAVGQPKR